LFSAIERYKLLPKDEDFVFNFAAASFPVATSQNFHALVGTGISFSISQLPGIPDQNWLYLLKLR
jgi:hypothetical protein